MRKRRPPQLPDSEYLGGVRIFFTMCTFRRKRYFESVSIAEKVQDELLRTASSHGVEIIAYCLMPDHLHFLSSGTDATSNTKGFVVRFRQKSGHAHRRLCGNRLWQDGYFDRTLRAEDATLDVVSYIVANPVRAGLCRSPVEYDFAGSSRYPLSELSSSVQWGPR